ncbi:MAG: hypothetical protein WD607_05640 [Candidatus Paceibacterota bacterium]
MRDIKYIFILFLLLVLMMGCVDTDPDKSEFNDRFSGIFYLHGTRTTVEDPCLHCAIGQDTLRETVTFSLFTRLDHDNPDRIQFYGLQGADTGDFGKRVFPDCTRSADCEIFGGIHSEELFEIDIENDGHHYQANGSIRFVDIELQGRYTYDNITIDYDLTGKRVSLTLDSN